MVSLRILLIFLSIFHDIVIVRLFKSLVILILISLSLGTAYAQQVPPSLDTQDVLFEDLVEMEPWLKIEKARQAMDRFNYSDALIYLQSAQEDLVNDPEIYLELARIYRFQGDSILSLEHYEQALEFQNFFNTGERYYLVRYELAQLYFDLGQYKNFEDQLTTIITDDVEFSSTDEFQANLRTAYVNNLQNSGINRMLVLYRLDDGFSLEAHRELGFFYVGSGRYKDALDHLVHATLKIFTTLVEQIRMERFDYVFTSIPQLFRDLEEDPQLFRYIDDSQLYKILHYLGGALYAFNQTALGRAQEIWQINANLPDSGDWGRLSERMAANPQVFPLLPEFRQREDRSFPPVR
jgi:tetratricopeptide (TPR) repeat protein